MVAHTHALEVFQHLPRSHSCIKGERLTKLGVPRFAKLINKETLCSPFRRLICVPVSDAGAMYGFCFGADHTSRAVGNQLVVDCWTFRTGERCY